MLPEILDLAEKAVVGRENGHHIGLDHLKDWVSSSWGDLGISLPTIRALEKG